MEGRTGTIAWALLWGWALLLPASAIGQALTFDASVDRTRIGLGDRITLTITVSGSDVDNVPDPTLPAMARFTVVGRTSSTSSNISIINGKISSSRTISYIYQLRPRKIGQAVIGAATIRYKGRVYRTRPITVAVTPDASPAPRNQAAPRPRTGSGRGTLPPGGRLDNDDLFIAATPDKTEAYIGEQITITYTLYTRVGLSNVQYDHIPSFTGFWMEELFSAEHLDFSPKILRGKRYDVAPLKRIALFPTVTGSQKLEPLSIVCDVPVARRRRSPFDSFFDDPFDSFFGRTQRKVVRAGGRVIKVLPLPAKGKPPNFSGGVGRFSLSGSIDKTKSEVNQPLTLSVVLTGQGNLKTVDAPVLPDMPDFKQYTSSSTEKISKQNGRIGGKKTYTYVLIPLQAGDLQIPPVAFSFFDPAEKTYRTVKTKPIMVSVAPGRSGPEVASGYPVNRSEVKQLTRDIQYIKPETIALTEQGALLYRSPWFLLLHALPIVSIIGVFMYKSHAQRLRLDVGYARWRRAHGAARRELQQAERMLKQGDVEKAYAGIAKALHTYIADKCNVSVAGLTVRQIADLLKTRGIKTDTLETLTRCLDACDMARFAPTTLTPEGAREVLDSAKQVIATLERRLVKSP